MTSTTEFCICIARASAEIQKILDAHVESFDEILPHVFMAELARYALTDGADRIELLELLEKAFATCDTEIQNLIAVSFVEGLTEGEIHKVLNGTNSPHLLAEWMNQNP